MATTPPRFSRLLTRINICRAIQKMFQDLAQDHQIEFGGAQIHFFKKVAGLAQSHLIV